MNLYSRDAKSSERSGGSTGAPLRSLRVAAIHLVVCALGVFVAFRPTLTTGFARLQCDPGDTLLNHYILEHSWLCLTRSNYVGTWWSPPCFYPEPLTLAYSENLFGTAPLYWLLRLGCSDTLAYQLWMIGVTAATYFAMAWAMQALAIRPILAALGAYIFAFGLPRLTQIGHQQLLPEIAAPVALMCAVRFSQTPTVGWFTGLLSATYWQILASIYLGWFLVLGLVIFMAERWLVEADALPRLLAFLRQRWPTVIWLGIVWGGLLYALLGVYAEANRGFHRSYAEVRELIPRPASWLATAPQSIWHPYLRPEPNAEMWIFPGATTFLLIGAALMLLPRLKERGLLIKAALLTAAVLAFVALRFGDSSPWYAVWKWAPGGQAIRAVSRLWTVVLLFALVGGLAAVSLALDGRRNGWVIAWTLLAVGVVEQIPWRGQLLSFDAVRWNASVESVQRQMKPGMVHYVGLAPGLYPYQGQLLAMWAGLKANVPVVNGYSGRHPLGYPDPTRSMTDAELSHWLAGRYTGIVEVIQPAPENDPGFQ